MSGRRLRVAAAALVATLVLAAGCGSARRGEPIVGPLELSPAAARGEQVFMANCHECHPRGEAGLGPALNDKPLPGFLIRFQVRNGLGAMPSFPEQTLSAPDLDALVDYLIEQRRHGRASST